MENHELAQILQAALPELTEVHVQSNDGSHFQVIAVSERFATLSRIKQQQTIYAPLMDYIADNRIHAVSIKTYTPDQWQKDRKLYNI